MFLDKASYDKIVGELSKMGKLISVSTVVDRFKVSGSIARRLVKDLQKTGQLKYLEAHSKQVLAVTTAAPKKVEETAATTKGDGKDAGKKQTKKAAKEAAPKWSYLKTLESRIRNFAVLPTHNRPRSLLRAFHHDICKNRQYSISFLVFGLLLLSQLGCFILRIDFRVLEFDVLQQWPLRSALLNCIPVLLLTFINATREISGNLYSWSTCPFLFIFACRIASLFVYILCFFLTLSHEHTSRRCNFAISSSFVFRSSFIWHWNSTVPVCSAWSLLRTASYILHSRSSCSQLCSAYCSDQAASRENKL